METMQDFETCVYDAMSSLNYYDLLIFRLRVFEGEHYSDQ